MRRMILMSGSSNPGLSEKIAKRLDAPTVDPQLVKFANGEFCCEIKESIRGADVFLIQSTCAPVNDNLMELLIMIDALRRASANAINVIIPHYGYARQDRKAGPRMPITAKLVANLITIAGATRVTTMDIHSGQTQGFFDIPFDNIYAAPLFVDYMTKELVTEKTILVSPDAGGVERVRFYAKKLKTEIAMIDKRRTGKNIAKAMNIVGNVIGREAIIIDDMVDTAGTLIEACKALKDNGATKVVAFATHPVLSNPAVERIASSPDLDLLVVTDTIPLSDEASKLSKIKVLTIENILAEAIKRTYNYDSLNSLFI